MPTGCQFPVAISNMHEQKHQMHCFGCPLKPVAWSGMGPAPLMITLSMQYGLWWGNSVPGSIHVFRMKLKHSEEPAAVSCKQNLPISVRTVWCEEAATPEKQRHSWYFDISNRHTSLFRKDSVLSYNSTTSLNSVKLKMLAVACCQPLQPIWQLTSLSAEGQFYSQNPFG